MHSYYSLHGVSSNANIHNYACCMKLNVEIVEGKAINSVSVNTLLCSHKVMPEMLVASEHSAMQCLLLDIELLYDLSSPSVMDELVLPEEFTLVE